MLFVGKLTYDSSKAHVTYWVRRGEHGVRGLVDVRHMRTSLRRGGVSGTVGHGVRGLEVRHRGTLTGGCQTDFEI